MIMYNDETSLPLVESIICDINKKENNVITQR